MRRVRGYGLTSVAAMLFTAACAPTIDRELQASLPQTVLVDALPLTVGVYYPPAFRDFHVHQMQANVHLGRASVALFDRVFPRVFERIVELPQRSPGPADVDAVIEPEIRHVVVNALELRFVYAVTLYSPDGESVATWTGHGGESGGEGIPVQMGADRKAERIGRALRRIAARFTVEFPNQPEVLQWLATRRSKSQRSVSSIQARS